MKLPDGVVDLRKVKTVIGEDARAHLTWVIAYNAQIEAGSERYEAIRAFGCALKPPRNTEQSVMYLPIAAPDTSQAPAPQPRPRARPKPGAKSGAKTGAKSGKKAQPQAKPRAKSRAKPPPKSRPRSAARSRAPSRAARRTPRRGPRS